VVSNLLYTSVSVGRERLPRIHSILGNVVLTCLLLQCSGRLWCQATSSQPEPGQPNPPLLLRDFNLQSMLHAPAHQVDRARFPVIDVHQHVNDARQRNEHIPPAQLLEIMDQCNIQKIVILTGMWGERLQKVVDEMVSLHVGNSPENLDYVSAMLDRLPNVMVEFGASEAELGRQRRRARKFFLDYQDRICFGTDMTPSEGLYRNHFRWLETADEYFDYWGSPGQGRWKIYGLDLPDSVLEKVYHLNAERVFRQFKGARAAR
jgi:hypothetical protein